MQGHWDLAPARLIIETSEVYRQPLFLSGADTALYDRFTFAAFSTGH
jgi:hypothetical protein